MTPAGAFRGAGPGFRRQIFWKQSRADSESCTVRGGLLIPG